MSHPASQHFHESNESHDLNSQLAFAGPRLNPSQFLTKDENFSRSQLTSVLVHCALAALLLIPLFTHLVPPRNFPAPSATTWLNGPIGDYLRHLKPAEQRPHGGGSGGDLEHETRTKGMLPIFTHTQIMPPSVLRNPNPAIELPPTLVGPEHVRISAEIAPNWGDPSADVFNNSNGKGKGGGIGDDKGTGIGKKGDGPGYNDGKDGGFGGNVYTPGGNSGVSYPACAYCPRPDYSDEARRAKYQGTVILNLVVLPDGRATSIEVLNSPGLGLDQKALEAVRTWRFTPAHDATGKPVAARIAIEVVFQLF